ncbi:hypothetical protein AB1Y20_000911 [Prymnesium parvum]|uniref:Alpha-L-arabinofuranosidase 1 catalytic domain-containing protein n=1 Tax=Prymnesium parvum TaxID=97485 RepID=A0AB34K794_PRYPA
MPSALPAFAFVYPTRRASLAFQPDLPHTAPPSPCNQSCSTYWSARAARAAERGHWLDSHATPLVLRPAGGGSAVPPAIFGYNLEMTRHGMFSGLSAQMVANRQFASADGRWPPPRWEGAREGAPRLEAPGMAGEGTYCVRCGVGGGHARACGVVQRRVGGGFDGGLSSGSSIPLLAGQEYTARVAVRSTARGAERALRLTVRLVDEEGNGTEVASRQWEEAAAAEGWTARTFNFTSALTTRSAVLSIVGQHAGKAKLLVRFWIGAVSLMPSDHLHGARADVVRLLSRMGLRGPARWPGGCYSSVAAPWEEGLRPPDERPPVRAPPAAHFCNAVPGGLQAHTDGYSEHWPSIDEYMRLVRLLRATPAVGMQVQFGSDEEIARGRAFVEYCNGAPSTPMGRLRAARGHPAPYGIQIWYLGNEIGVQGRYPPTGRRGEWGEAVGAATPREYAAILSRLVPALLEVDGSLRLVGANAAPNVSIPFAAQERLAAVWNAPYLEAVGARLWAHSHHHYFRQPAEWTPHSMSEAVKRGQRHAVGSLAQFARRIGAASVSLDEWGLGPPWSTAQFGVPHAVYAAALLMHALRHAAELQLRAANFYAPVNEGAISVGAWNSSFTPVGHVLELLGRHQGGRLLHVGDGWRHADDDDLEVLATAEGEGGARGGEHAGRLRLTVANKNAAAARAACFHVCESLPHGSAAAARRAVGVDAVVLRAADIDPTASLRLGDPGRYVREQRVLAAEVESAAPRSDGAVAGERCLKLPLDVPPFSVIHAEIHLPLKGQTR